LGVSRPLQSPIKLNTGRNEVLTTLDISVITIIQAILGKQLKFRVDTTVLTNIAPPIIVSQVYEKDIKIPFVGEKLGLKGIDLL
jgi:hypothetical protein